MAQSAGKSKPSGGKLTHRGLFWRCWIAGSLAWLLLIGFDVSSSLIRQQDLSIEALRLESDIGKSIRGSEKQSSARSRLLLVNRQMSDAQYDMVRGGALIVAVPLIVLVIGFVASLAFGARDDEE